MISAAAVTVDITPSDLDHIYVAGFSHNKPATGVHRSIHARILCLRDESGPLVLVSLDLIGLPASEADRIRDLCDGIPGERIFVAATHTHAGPDTIGLWGKHLLGLPLVDGRDKNYISWMIHQVAGGIRKSVQRLQPARIGFIEDVAKRTEWIVNIQVEGAAYYDNTISIMRVDGADGTPIACVSNFACHPETLSDANTRISPDFPGFMHDVIESKTGAVSIFFNGALGAMVTGNVDLEGGDVSVNQDFASRLGDHLGEVISADWQKIETKAIDAFVTSTTPVSAPVQNRKFRFMFRTGLLPGRLKRGRVSTSLFVLTIGDAQFASLPGEPAPVTGFAAKDLMSRRYKFLIGLGNDELGYLLDQNQYSDKEHYGYERTVSIGPKGLSAIMEVFGRVVTGA